MPAKVQVESGVRNILERCQVKGKIIVLPCQLSHPAYLQVDKVLKAMGGKWNRRLGGHEFEEDPAPLLEAALLAGEVVTPQAFGFFPTPEPLARLVLLAAALAPGMKVLEPSAGRGNLALPAAEIVGQEAVHCVELLPKNCATLHGLGFRVVEADFLTLEPSPEFDRVVMNPPFANQADLDHVRHAWEFVRPGGRLVAIMSAGVGFRDNRKTLSFRAFLDEYGWFQPNPDGSFDESGTQVRTVLAVADKPRERAFLKLQ